MTEFERVHLDHAIGEGTDARFHGRIAQAAGNTVLMHLMATLHKALTRCSLNVAARFQASDLYRETILQQHRALFEAIRAHDPEAARARMQEHLDYVVRELRYHARRAPEPMAQRADPRTTHNRTLLYGFSKAETASGMRVAGPPISAGSRCSYQCATSISSAWRIGSGTSLGSEPKPAVNAISMPSAGTPGFGQSPDFATSLGGMRPPSSTN